jgi:hypothetical protein
LGRKRPDTRYSKSAAAIKTDTDSNSPTPEPADVRFKPVLKPTKDVTSIQKKIRGVILKALVPYVSY